jgi:ATP/maltotriose-dependent transcriptional regulator MalT
LGRDNAGQLEHIDRGLAAVGVDPQVGDLRVLLLSNRAGVLADLDRQDEARVAAASALRVAEQAGTPRIATSHAGLAFLYVETGQWDDALAELETTMAQPAADTAHLLARALLAQLAVHRGDAAAAAGYLDAIDDDELSQPTARAIAHPVLLARALDAEQAGQPDQAVAILAPACDPEAARSMPGAFLLLPMLTRLALAIGDRPAAAAAAAAAAGEADTEPLPRKTAVAGHCAALLSGDPGPALAAARYHAGAGRPLDAAQAAEDAAVLAAMAGDRAAARAGLSDAARGYASLDASWDRQRATARLGRYGVRGHPGPARRRAPAHGWAALTPTELRVARLVADGLSNPDIATELFLSRYTVQTHVSHILAKLHAVSRAEVIRQALSQPGTDSPLR